MTQRQPESLLPLSPLQEGMLFHSLLDPDTDVDFEQWLYRLEGPLDIDALTDSWQTVANRHSALRARFVTQGLDAPRQLVAQSVTVPVAVVDWTSLDDYEAELDDWLANDRKAAFTLSEPPLLRVAVMLLGAGGCLMVVSFHHLLLDGWSTELIMRELFDRYRQQITRTPAALEPAPSHDGYLRWLQHRDQDAAAAYWRAVLGDFTTPTQLVTERRISESGWSTAVMEFSPAETEQLTRSAEEQGIGLTTLLQGAWALLLARYSGSPDVLFGATVSVRPDELDHADAMIGLLINTIPVRVQVAAGQPARDWLQDLHRSQLAGRPHAASPLVLAQGSSGVPQGTALFQSLLVCESRPADAGTAAGAPARVRAVQRTGYPLTVVVLPGNRLLLEITYDRSAFDADRISAMAGHLRVLLTSLATAPDTVVGDVPMLSEAERELILSTWNNTAAAYPSDRCIHELFEDQVALRPDALAVTDLDGSRLSYRQLNERANQLAHRLRELDAAPERTVGICASASANALVGLLGILKSGAGYVPLDPGHPAQRLALLLADTDAAIVVADPASASALPESYPADRLVLLDPDDPAIAAQPVTNPDPWATPENLAYVMFTSGSTGRPKGVLVHHRGLVNYLWWAIEGYGLYGAAGAPMFGSIAVDLSMPNYFLPLIGGKDVTVLTSDSGLDSVQRKLREPGDFSLLKITPGHLDVLRHSLDSEQIVTVRTYVIGADEVKAETMAAWQKIASGARLINEYGPTETVVGCSIYIADADFDPTVPVPIGKPIANTRMYVLDERLHPVPAGVIGELFIGGDGVARGYLNRPGITAEKFIPDPFAPSAGDRMYRTGDLARFRPDGNLEFLGRSDHQVKVRGYRIELGEIEARLLSLDGITEAVVVAREDVPGDRRLVAYLVSRGDRPSVSRLRAWLAEALPAYMVPEAFVMLPALPLSGNGKVDRTALPAPATSRPELAEGPVAPRTEMEKRIAAIWCQVLGLDEVGVTDSFFDLGGQSLRATQMASRLARLGHGKVPLRILFAHPTVAAQASWLAEQPNSRPD